MPPSALHDRVVRLRGGADALAQLASVLASRTRLAVLDALIASPGPLHINEIARRVGVDASPVRTHLEILAHAGLVQEDSETPGRERRFTTRLQDARITLDGVSRPRAPEKHAKPTKEVARARRRLDALEREMATLQEKARKARAELDAAWEAAARAGEG